MRSLPCGCATLLLCNSQRAAAAGGGASPTAGAWSAADSQMEGIKGQDCAVARHKHLLAPGILLSTCARWIELLLCERHAVSGHTMPLSLNALLALSVALCLSLQYGMGVPLSSVSDLGSDPALNSAPHRVRSKRCSCNNQMDSECHYFCHLDIIWVNTPSKTTIYGLGSPLSRRRRSTGRCACANPADHTCNSFCHNSSLNPTLVVVNPSPLSLGSSDDTSSNLLTSLRYAVRANLLAARLGVSPRKKPSQTHR
ncbi:hypothetical protein AGOR_G00120740 [Albula goreensis]|uniref:Endothelin-like toxin domain-containing protein n=1 Tax=Albula goreensis TaxID=1534307 RepID=A0A8T3DDN0_9TELE|nr:hypothetical protein AGOR_G00120740 [Albula goreensis]